MGPDSTVTEIRGVVSAPADQPAVLKLLREKVLQQRPVGRVAVVRGTWSTRDELEPKRGNAAHRH